VGLTVSQALDVVGSRHHRLGEDDSTTGPRMASVISIVGSRMVRGCIASWARGGRRCCMLRNGIASLGMRPVWSMASPAQVGEDGGM
jgi:hypothetical protein